MSPRAAVRLETLGFIDVYDYVAGKSDWLAAGLDIEGTDAHKQTVKLALTTDDVTVLQEETLGAVRALVQAAGKRAAIVVGPSNVVLGRIRGKNLSREDSVAAGEAMRSGPTTIRPDMELHAAIEWMKSVKVRSVLVTTPEGRLLGTLELANAEKVASASSKTGRSRPAGSGTTSCC